jgi:hypothetical protein
LDEPDLLSWLKLQVGLEGAPMVVILRMSQSQPLDAELIKHLLQSFRPATNYSILLLTSVIEGMSQSLSDKPKTRYNSDARLIDFTGYSYFVCDQFGVILFRCCDLPLSGLLIKTQRGTPIEKKQKNN